MPSEVIVARPRTRGSHRLRDSARESGGAFVDDRPTVVHRALAPLRTGYHLGIDLGSSRVSAAICRSGGDGTVQARVVQLGGATAAVPSTLFVPGDGTVVVGDAAELRARLEPERVLRGFRRRVGDPVPIHVAGEVRTAEDLLAGLARWVVDRVAAAEGGPPDRIAVSVPTAWGSYSRELVDRAMAAEGLRVVLVAEPRAAVLQLVPVPAAGAVSTVAVYDLGGGTFDAAVLRCSRSAAGVAEVELLGPPEGIDCVGGADFDDLVLDHVRRAAPDAFAALGDHDAAAPSAIARLRVACREAKEALSADTEVVVPVLLPGASTSVRLHRAEFETLVRPLVEDTVAALDRAIASAGVSPSDLDEVLLVGGSSRIPLVTQLVSDRLGRPVTVLTDPENAVACGAARALVEPPGSQEPTDVVPVVAPPPRAPAGPGDAVRRGGVHDRQLAFPVRPPKRRPDQWLTPRPTYHAPIRFATRVALLCAAFVALLVGALVLWQVVEQGWSTVSADTGRPPAGSVPSDPRPTPAVPSTAAVPEEAAPDGDTRTAAPRSTGPTRGPAASTTARAVPPAPVGPEPSTGRAPVPDPVPDPDPGPTAGPAPDPVPSDGPEPSAGPDPAPGDVSTTPAVPDGP